MSERGQTVPLVLLLVALAAAAALVVAELGARAVHAADARTAADAAALAGAVGGEPAARAAAEANGGRLLDFRQRGADALVTVEVEGSRAQARARNEGAVGAGAGGSATGLDPRLRAAIARAEALLGQPVPITSGWRSPAEQQRLWDRRHLNPFPVARPGTSRHEQGLAIDVPRSFVARLRSVAAAAGLCFPMPSTDPIHFELCPGAP